MQLRGTPNLTPPWPTWCDSSTNQDNRHCFGGDCRDKRQRTRCKHRTYNRRLKSDLLETSRVLPVFPQFVLIPPTTVQHQRAAVELATLQHREAIDKHGLQDHAVTVEMTGTYHRIVQLAFRKAGSEPQSCDSFRQPFGFLVVRSGLTGEGRPTFGNLGRQGLGAIKGFRVQGSGRQRSGFRGDVRTKILNPEP